MARLAHLAVLLIPAVADAAGLDATTLGTTTSGPATCDAAAIYWNPALLATLQHPELIAGAGIALGRASYRRQRLGRYQLEDTFDFAEPVADLDASKTGPAEEVTATPLAPFGEAFFAMPLTERVTAGLGVYAPYAVWLRLPADGPQRFQLQQAFIALLHVTPAVGVRIIDELYIGAGISYELGRASFARAQDFAGLDAFGDALQNPPLNQPNDLGLEAPSTVRELDVLERPFVFDGGMHHGVTFNAGLAYRPTAAWTVGLSYHHGSTVSADGSFQLDMNDDFFTRDLVAQGVAFPTLVEGDATLAFATPKRLSLAAAWAFDDRWAFTLLTTVAFWTAHDAMTMTVRSSDLAQPGLGIPDTLTVELPRSWQNTVQIELGTEVRWSPTLSSSLTAGYHSPVSPDATMDTASLDGHRLLGAAGVAWQAFDGITLLLAGEVQGILPRTVTTSDFDLGNGTYSLVVAALTMHVRVDLD